MVAKITRARRMAKVKGRIAKVSMGKLTPNGRKLARERVQKMEDAKRVGKVTTRKRRFKGRAKKR